MAHHAIPAVLERHWADITDVDIFHETYHEDVVVEYPQTGERVEGRATLWAGSIAPRAAAITFAVQRVHEAGNLWVTEGVLTVDEVPLRTVMVRELRDGKVARETTYVGQSSEPPAWNTRLGRGAPGHGLG